MIFIPVLDWMISELKRRLWDNNVVLIGVSSFNSKSNTFLNLSIIQPLAVYFKLHIRCVELRFKFILNIIIRYQEENSCLDLMQTKK